MGGYIFTLLKRHNKALLQKSETNTFNQKWFRKELVQSQKQKSRAFWEFNVCRWHCSTMFWICPTFSHFTFHISLEVLYDNWSLLEAVNNGLTRYIKLYNYVMLRPKKPIKVFHLQKLANSQCWLAHLYRNGKQFF